MSCNKELKISSANFSTCGPDMDACPDLPVLLETAVLVRTALLVSFVVEGWVVDVAATVEVAAFDVVLLVLLPIPQLNQLLLVVVAVVVVVAQVPCDWAAKEAVSVVVFVLVSGSLSFTSSFSLSASELAAAAAAFCISLAYCF